MLQPSDVAVNKQMKDTIYRKYNEGLSSNHHTFIASGRLCEPTLKDIAECNFQFGMHWMHP